MDGSTIVKILDEDFGVKIEPATKSQWRKAKTISPTLMRNALKKFKSQSLSSAIKPIVEFHKLEFEHGKNADSFGCRLNDGELVDRLKKAVGIYAFFLRLPAGCST